MQETQELQQEDRCYGNTFGFLMLVAVFPLNSSKEHKQLWFGGVIAIAPKDVKVANSSQMKFDVAVGCGQG